MDVKFDAGYIDEVENNLLKFKSHVDGVYVSFIEP